MVSFQWDERVVKGLRVKNSEVIRLMVAVEGGGDDRTWRETRGINKGRRIAHPTLPFLTALRETLTA